MYLQRFQISALVPEPFASELAAWRKSSDHWSNSWLPPHITIVPPFLADLSRERLLEIERWPLNLPVSFGGWGSYNRPDSHVIWIDPGQDAPREIRPKFLEDFPELKQFIRDQSTNPQFHVTVANRVPDADFPKVLEELSQKRLSGTGEIPQLAVFVWDRLTSRWIFQFPR